MNEPLRLAVVGDSIAEGVGDGVGLGSSWADLVAAGLGAEAYLNLGQRGLLASAIRSTQLEAAIACGPEVAVVCAGGNDLFGRVFDPVALAVELEGLVGGLAAVGALVVTFGLFDLSGTQLLPAARRPELRRRLLALNAVTRRTTRRHRGVHVDFFDHLAQHQSLLSADKLHPNRRGHAHMAVEVLRAVTAAARGAQARDRPRPAAAPALRTAPASSGGRAGPATG